MILLKELRDLELEDKNFPEISRVAVQTRDGRKFTKRCEVAMGMHKSLNPMKH